MSTTRRVLALAAVATASVGALTIAAPAQADTHRTTEKVFFTADADKCWTTPDASTTGKPASVRPVLGGLYKATPAQYDGVGVGRGDDTFRWIEIAPSAGCYVTADETSEAVKNDLNPSGWKVHSVVAPGARGMGLGAVLNAGDRTLHAAPSAASKALSEVEEGDVLLTSGWSIDGGNPSVSGRKVWAPVVYSGVVAWIPAASLAPIPTYTVADLISTITAERTVTVREQPSTASEPLGDLAAGETAPALQNETVGWIPVAIDGRVGWVSETDLLADPTASPSAAPTESSSTGVLDDARANWEGLKAKRGAGWSEAAKAATEKAESRAKRLASHNAGGRLIAQGRLWPAVMVAVLASMLAIGGAGIRRRRGLPTLIWLSANASLPVASLLALWATLLAPSNYFQPPVLIVTAAVGAILAFVTALRIAGKRSKQIARGQWSVLAPVVVGALVGALVRWRVGLPAASSVLTALITAGAVLGAVARLPALSRQRASEPAPVLAVEEEVSR